MPNITENEYIKYKEACREYENYLMAEWGEYAIKKALLKEGIEKGKREMQTQVARNLLSAKKFTIEEIANFASVSEPFVRRIKKEMKK